MIVRIQQPNGYGCLVACLAMVLGRSYVAVEKELHAAVFRPEQSPGISFTEADALMDRYGYALVRRYRFDPIIQKPREVWPPLPFAPVHICHVQATRGSHACVMDSEGRIYDPWSAERFTLAHPDYKAVDHVDGWFERTGAW